MLKLDHKYMFGYVKAYHFIIACKTLLQNLEHETTLNLYVQNLNTISTDYNQNIKLSPLPPPPPTLSRSPFS